MKPNLKPLVLALFCASFSNTAFAADRAWLGALGNPSCNSAFSTAACWQNNILPSTIDRAVFQGTLPDVFINQSVTTDDALVASFYQWRIADNVEYRLRDDFAIASNSQLILYGSGVTTDGFDLIVSPGAPSNSLTLINGDLLVTENTRALFASGTVIFASTGTTRVVGNIKVNNFLTLKGEHIINVKDVYLGRNSANVNQRLDIGRSLGIYGSAGINAETLTINGSLNHLFFSVDQNGLNAPTGLVNITNLLTVSAGAVDLLDGGRLVAGSINLANAAEVDSTSGMIGSTSTALKSISTQGDVSLTGNGTRWTSNTLLVTNNRTLTLNDQATVTARTKLTINNGGSVIVRNLLDTSIDEGLVSTRNLLIESAGTLSSQNGFIGANPGNKISQLRASQTATVTGTGSKWTITSGLTVGNTGQLQVNDNALIDVAGSFFTDGNTLVNIHSAQVKANTLSTGGEFNVSNNSLVDIAATLSAYSTTALIHTDASQIKANRVSLTSGSQLTASNSGSVEITKDLKISSQSSADTGTGRFTASSFLIQSAGQLTSSNGGVGRVLTTNGSASSSNDAKVTGTDSLWLTGNLEITNGKTLFVENNANIVTRALDINAGGHLVVDNSAVAAINIFGVGNGNIHISGATSSLDLTHAIIDANVNLTDASLNGTGIINGNVTGIGANIGPGNSPGLLTVAGNFSVDNNSSILFELGGLLTQSEYDVIDVTGTADLAGEIVVDLFDLGSGLFAPSAGDFFDILTAETITGSFDLLTLGALDSSLQWQLSYLTDFQGSTDVLRLSAVSAVPVPAAVWLFGSGLLGLVGVARRKTV